MRILIATPLYPPDVEPSAEYGYELATRLSEQHSVTVVTYGTLIEPTSHVTVVAVPKDAPLVGRMIQYAHAVRKLMQSADVIIVHNGPSVELPVALATLFSRTTLILHESDARAGEVRKRNIAHSLIHTFISLRARHHLRGVPLKKPETLPFAPFSAEAHELYTQSWNQHLAHLTTTLTHES